MLVLCLMLMSQRAKEQTVRCYNRYHGDGL